MKSLFFLGHVEAVWKNMNKMQLKLAGDKTDKIA